MTRREAAIVSAFTGFMLGDFSAMHEYAEELMGRSIFTHEFGHKAFSEELKRLALPDFLAIHEAIVEGSRMRRVLVATSIEVDDPVGNEAHVEWTERDGYETNQHVVDLDLGEKLLHDLDELTKFATSALIDRFEPQDSYRQEMHDHIIRLRAVADLEES